MIKRLDSLGRVVVPKGFRLKLGLKPGDPLDFEIKGNRIIISLHEDGCTFCGRQNAEKVYLSKKICGDCISRIRSIRLP